MYYGVLFSLNHMQSLLFLSCKYQGPQSTKQLEILGFSRADSYTFPLLYRVIELICRKIRIVIGDI